MQVPSASELAAAFDLGSPARLQPVGGEVSDAWRLRTRSGSYFVKRVRRDEPDWWRESAARSMTFERRALAEGLPFPQPIDPVVSELGFIARVAGGLFRAYEWIDGRPLRHDDDVSEWLGTTAARIHALEPYDNVDRWIYGLHPIEEWERWLGEGHRKGLAWAPGLEAQLPAIAQCLDWVARALDSAAGFVMSHRDLEPWNVLVTANGPALVDLDGAGPDCAVLELAHAALVFALRGRSDPDPRALNRVVAAYVAAGGQPLPRGRAVFARRVGMKLNRLTWHMWITLGHRPALQDHAASLEQAAASSLEELPILLAHLDAWAALLV